MIISHFVTFILGLSNIILKSYTCISHNTNFWCWPMVTDVLWWNHGVSGVELSKGCICWSPRYSSHL